MVLRSCGDVSGSGSKKKLRLMNRHSDLADLFGHVVARVSFVIAYYEQHNLQWC